MRKSTAGIVRGEWTFNEREYYLEALHYYDEVIFIDPRRVTFTLDRRKNLIVVQHEGMVLNDLAMLYTFGRIDETLLLVKYLERCGCPTSDPFNTISRDCLGKITESLHIFSSGAGTTSHVLTSLSLAREYLEKLDSAYFPLLNKPISGNQGKGIVALYSFQEAIEFCEAHFKKRDVVLVFEQLMKYRYEYRVYVVDGKTVETYEKVRNDDAVVMNLHQGASPRLVEEAVKEQIFAFIEKHLPERYRLGVYGVDLAVTDEGQYHIIEINRTPGFTGLIKLHLLNFPGYVHKVLSKRSRRSSVPDVNKQGQTITLLGDTNPGETYQLRLEQLGKENILKTRGYDYSFEKFQDFLRESDFTIINLEACITGQRQSSLETIKPYLDWTDVTETPNLLKRLRVNAVSLANNHTLDFGTAGMEEMLNSLRDHNIVSFGAGRSTGKAEKVLHHHVSLGERNLHVIVASGFEHRENHVDWDYYATADSAGVNSWGKTDVVRQLKNLRELYPDAFLIAFPHWGSNYQYVSDRQKALAQNIIDAGADLIVGHGSHMMQEIEVYKGRWILYGIGNFVYNSPGRFSRYDVLPFGLLTRLTVSECNDRICINVQNYPTCIDNDKTGYQSHFVTERQFRQVVDFFMPHHKDKKTNLERRMRAGKDNHGFYLAFDIFPE
jgi:poly-gamma-glutamate capsule biosynthesis protein CapA/YwtB (metallophosphatase superfamily)/glutathione synthase/RimK-type ligase-like ATP-grasp enzyme